MSTIMTKFGKYRRYLLNSFYQTFVVSQRGLLLELIPVLAAFSAILEQVLLMAGVYYCETQAVVRGDCWWV